MEKPIIFNTEWTGYSSVNNSLRYQEDNAILEIFTKCFICLENLSDDMFPKFVFTLWSKPPEGISNIRSRWSLDFYASTPIKAMEKGYTFLIKNKEKNFNMTESECLSLRNELNS